jgi:4-amino-4-deoxy-L-arabinose transferase-like glycosyltransferase
MMIGGDVFRLPTKNLKILLAVALLMRLVWLVCLGIEPVSDGVMYREFSRSIANGAGYAYPDGQLTVYWAVGASAFYALLKFLFGFSESPIAFANLVVGVGVVWLTWLIALRYFGRSVADGAGWIVALWPVLIQFTTVYASELLFIFLLLFALYVWGGKEGNATLRAVAWGTLLCAAVYVRPTAMPLFAALPAVYFFSTRDLKGALLSIGIASITAAVLLSPWVVRNQQVFGSPVLVSANFGSNLWMGNNPASTGAYMPLPDIQFANEIARDQYFKAQAIEFIKANPLEYTDRKFNRMRPSMARVLGLETRSAKEG